MKHLGLLLLLLACPARAQLDTLRYDGISDVWSGQLINISIYPGERESVYNVRATPVEKCRLEGVIVGMSVVKFAPASGPDTLEVLVYESTAPPLVSVGDVRIGLGTDGYPPPNINPVDPLNSGARDALYVPIVPPIPFAPKRDILVGVTVRSRQSMPIGTGAWNGFALATQTANPEYARYCRHVISNGWSSNDPASPSSSRSFFIRPVVRYDAAMKDTAIVAVRGTAHPQAPALEVYPNPSSGAATIALTADRATRAALDVYDAMGRRVAALADGPVPAGTSTFVFDAGAGLPPGVYLARARVGDRVLAQRIVALR
jgi:hypothetical protein